MNGGGKPERKRSVAQRAWSQSAACAAAAERGREQAAAQREAAPKCGAKARAGGSCQGLALENGRCRIHGGLTPKGDQWHRMQYPSATAPPAKLDKKLKEIERRRRLQAERVAAMPPDERARYERRSEAAKPRSRAAREQTRRNREAVEILKRSTRAPESAEQAELREACERLESDLARINAALAIVTPQSEGNTQ